MSSVLKKLAVCVFYGCASASLSLINKGVFHLHNYKFPNMVLLIQFIYGVLFTTTFKIVQPEGIPRIWKVPEFSLEKMKNCAILSFTFLANVMSGITAISKVNIPVFLAFRRLTTTVIFLTDVFILKKKPNKFEVFGVICISAGAILAGVNVI
jgi:drug/metabolite transporter (DMT)-like permease